MSGACVLRPECAGDARVMHAVFVATRRGPIDAAGLDPATVLRLMGHQFQLQRASYRAAYPVAAWEAIVVEGVVVGRIITDADAARLLLIDIMVDPARQRAGIGSTVLTALIARAGARPIELRVDHGSPAEAWYRRFGFAPVSADALQAHLVRDPHATALAMTGVPQ